MRSAVWFPIGHASRVAVLLLALALHDASRCEAQLSWTFDPSVRAAGMGGGGGAVFWGGDPNAFVNPALLGYTSGVRVDYQNFDNGAFESARLRVGVAGIGVLFSGNPDGVGWYRLRPPLVAEITRLFPPPLDPSSTSSWSVGASLANLMSALSAIGGQPTPALFRHFDVAAGYTQKQLPLPDEIAGPFTLVDGSVGTPTQVDYGVLVRLTPIDTFDQPRASHRTSSSSYSRVAPSLGHAPGESWIRWVQKPERPPGDEPLRVDFSYAYTIQNANDFAPLANVWTFSPLQWTTRAPEARIHRHSVAARMASGAPKSLSPILNAAFTPLVNFGASMDFERWEPDPVFQPGATFDNNRYGIELTFANVLSFRTGGGDQGWVNTSSASVGVGLGFQIGSFLGARWDWARTPVPQNGLRTDRQGWTAWFDPFAAFREARKAQAARHRGRDVVALGSLDQ